MPPSNKQKAIRDTGTTHRPMSVPPSPASEDRHPLSNWIRQYLDQWPGGTQEQLATKLQVDQSHVSRLLRLTPSERPSLDLLRRLFELSDREIREHDQRRGKLPTDFDRDSKWHMFVQKRSDYLFVELAKAMAQDRERANASAWLLTKEDEYLWELEAKPKDRWILTDELAEARYRLVLERTCSLLVDRDFQRLVILMPRAQLALGPHPNVRTKVRRLEPSPESQFASFRRQATGSGLLGNPNSAEQLFDRKVRCIALPPSMPVFVRLRLDDFNDTTPYTSGVAVFAHKEPVIVRLTDEAMRQIGAWLIPVVNELEYQLKNQSGTDSVKPICAPGPGGFELVSPSGSLTNAK